MAIVQEVHLSDLVKEVEELRAENAKLKKILDQQDTHIADLEDVFLTLEERSILLGR